MLEGNYSSKHCNVLFSDSKVGDDKVGDDKVVDD